MVGKVAEWEKEDIHASGSRLGQMKEDVKTLEAKLDALVDLYLNQDIERDIYLTKKDALMRQKIALQAKSSSARAERKNWIEPLRKWILDSKRAGFLASGENLSEMRNFLRDFGTNPSMQDKTIAISFCSLYETRYTFWIFQKKSQKVLRNCPIRMGSHEQFLTLRIRPHSKGGIHPFTLQRALGARRFCSHSCLCFCL